MRAGWFLIGGLACALPFPREAGAVERQQHLGVSAGGTEMSLSGAGPNLGLHYTYGLWDAVNLVVEADASAFVLGNAPKVRPPAPGLVATGGVGLMYVFDVLRWIPYAGGIIGAGYLGGGWLSSPLVTPDAQLAVGLDYQLSRTWTIGAAYRQHFLLTQMNTYPELTSVGLRFEYVWGW
jgi:hypothetical protein